MIYTHELQVVRISHRHNGLQTGRKQSFTKLSNLLVKLYRLFEQNHIYILWLFALSQFPCLHVENLNTYLVSYQYSNEFVLAPSRLDSQPDSLLANYYLY